jgi:hypothetical protein
MPTAIATPLNAGLNRVATQPVMKPVVAAMDNAIAIVGDAVDVVAVTDKAIVANAPSAMSAANEMQRVQHARHKTLLLRVKPVSHANRVNRDRIVAPVAKVSAKVSAKVVRVRVSAMADVMVDAMVVAKAGMTLHAIRKKHVPIKRMRWQHRLRAATKRRRRTVLAGNAANAAVNDVSVVSAGNVVNAVANAANVARTLLPSLRQPVARYRCAATTTQLSTVSRKLKAAISKRITSRNHKPALLAGRA